jgi:hypothetical protein
VLAEHGKLIFILYYRNPVLRTGSNPVLETLLFPCTAIFETLSEQVPVDCWFELSHCTSKLLSAYLFMFLTMLIVATTGYILRHKQFMLSFFNSIIVPDIVLYTV